MRARVSEATLKRLGRIEQSRANARPRGDFPPIMGHEAWEALAMATQEKLCADTRGYLDAVYPPEPDLSDTMDVTHRYKRGAAPLHVNPGIAR